PSDAPTLPHAPVTTGSTTNDVERITQSAPRTPLRILLADDHTLLRKTLVSYLEQRDDFVVVGEASNGEEALRLTLELQPNVLILDLNMPGKGGLDILPDLREQAPNIKVLVLTGRNED